MKNAVPWMVVVVALSAMYPVAQVAKSTGEKAGGKETPPPPKTEAAADEGCHAKGGAPAWCEPVRLIREFFGLEAAPGSPLDVSLQEVVDQASLSGYELRP